MLDELDSLWRGFNAKGRTTANVAKSMRTSMLFAAWTVFVLACFSDFEKTMSFYYYSVPSQPGIGYQRNIVNWMKSFYDKSI